MGDLCENYQDFGDLCQSFLKDNQIYIEKDEEAFLKVSLLYDFLLMEIRYEDEYETIPNVGQLLNKELIDREFLMYQMLVEKEFLTN
jgi:hypothetical protein